MWRWIPVLAAAAGLLPARAGAAQQPKPKVKNPTGAPPGRSVQAPAAQPKPRFYIPGVGGAVPPKPKPQAASPSAQVYGPPLLPTLPGKSPATVVVPGQKPTLPGMPGGDTFGALQAVRVSPLIYGVNVAWGDAGGRANWDRDGMARARRLSQLLKASGATMTRVEFRWRDVEAAKGRYDWAATDRFMRMAAGLGVKLVGVIHSAPDWASGATPEAWKILRERGASEFAPSPASVPDLARFAFALSQRYRGKIEGWEVWTEPDANGMAIPVKDASGRMYDVRFADAPAFAAVLKAVSRALRRTTVNVPVAVGGLSQPGVGFLVDLYAAGARGSFDAVALRPEMNRSGLDLDWIDRCREVMTASGDSARTIWLSSWGQAAGPDTTSITPAHLARLIRDAFAGLRARPYVSQAAYASLNDWRRDEKDPASVVRKGLTSESMVARPAFAAFRESALGRTAAAARAYHRAGLIGALPSTDEAGVRAAYSTVEVDAGRPGEPLAPLWDGFVQGRDAADYESLSAVAGRLKPLKPGLIRFDPFPNPDSVKVAAADTGPRTAAQNPAAPLIDWSYVDGMGEAIIAAGARPFINMATMPIALSAPVGNTRMPRDMAQWSRFVESAVRHVNGDPKRRAQYWELSHEPDTGDYNLREWLALYEQFARAVTTADPAARVGGPATAGFNVQWLRALIDYCAANDVPLHFLSWHAYGQPAANLPRQAAEIREYLARYPRLKGAELFVSEWATTAGVSPENDGLQAATDALNMAERLSAAGVRGLRYSVRDGRDPRSPGLKLSGRWGLFTADGAPKPVYYAFRLLARMEGRRLAAASDESSIHALAVESTGRTSVLLWRDSSEGSGGSAGSLDSPVRLRIHGLPWRGAARGVQWILDSPESSAESPVASFRLPAGDAEIPLVMPPGSIALLELERAAPVAIEVTAETASYLAFGGSPWVVGATVRNASAAPRDVVVTASTSDPALRVTEPASRRITLKALKPGESRTVRFTLSSPVAPVEKQQFFRVDAGGGSASVAVKLASPLRARLSPARFDLDGPGAAPDSQESSARFTVSLENRGAATLRAGIVGGRQVSDAVTLQAHKTVPAPITLAAPDSRPGNYLQPLRILLDQKPLTTLDAVIGVPALCRRAARKPRIDADLEEWSGAFPLSVGAAGQGAVFAQVMTQWDEENLYVAAAVHDDLHFQPFAGEEMTRGDCVALGIDAGRDGGWNHVGLDSNDSVIGLALTRNGPELYRLEGRGGPRTITGAALTVRRVGSRTLYEAAIPWSAIGRVRPRDGAIVGFAAAVYDSDGRVRRSAEWPGGLLGTPRPGRFVGLRLVK